MIIPCALWRSMRRQAAVFAAILFAAFVVAACDGEGIVPDPSFTDPFPVTFTQADDIWGQYSQRYTDMALAIRDATGLPVDAWCFVEGAHATRIFYKYELPELVLMEQQGAVRVFFARTQDASWLNSDDWIEGTANAPTPLPSISEEEPLLDISSADVRDPAYARGVHWDDF